MNILDHLYIPAIAIFILTTLIFIAAIGYLIAAELRRPRQQRDNIQFMSYILIGLWFIALSIILAAQHVAIA